LDAVVDTLNARPRKTLDFATPGEHFTRLLARLAGGQIKPACSVHGGDKPGQWSVGALLMRAV
jgi:hypothetical protein